MICLCMEKMRTEKNNQKNGVHFSVAFNEITKFYPFHFTRFLLFSDFAFAFPSTVMFSRVPLLHSSMCSQFLVQLCFSLQSFSIFIFHNNEQKKKKTQVPKDDENEWKNEMWMHDDGAASKGKAIQHEKEWVIQSAFRFIALSSTSSLSTVSEIFSNGNEVFHFSTSTSAQFRNFRFHFANGKNIEAYVWGARTTCIRQNIQMDTKWRKVAQAHQALAPVSPAPK